MFGGLKLELKSDATLICFLSFLVSAASSVEEDVAATRQSRQLWNYGQPHHLLLLQQQQQTPLSRRQGITMTHG